MASVLWTDRWTDRARIARDREYCSIAALQHGSMAAWPPELAPPQQQQQQQAGNGASAWGDALPKTGSDVCHFQDVR